MSESGKLPWDRLILAAMRLGVMPSSFWQLSLREWQMLTRAKSRSGFAKADLSRLLAAFPDKENKDER